MDVVVTLLKDVDASVRFVVARRGLLDDLLKPAATADLRPVCALSIVSQYPVEIFFLGHEPNSITCLLN